MIHIWMESLFVKEANPSGPTSKDVRNQWESSKQVTVQNLSGRCVRARSYRNGEAPRAAMAMMGVLDIRSLAQSEEGKGELLGGWRGE
jgi:hypothetical protein